MINWKESIPVKVTLISNENNANENFYDPQKGFTKVMESVHWMELSSCIFNNALKWTIMGHINECFIFSPHLSTSSLKNCSADHFKSFPANWIRFTTGVPEESELQTNRW